MNAFCDNDLGDYHEQFDRDHDRLRSELMAALPECPSWRRPAAGASQEASFGQRIRTVGRMPRAAAVLAVGVGIIGTLLWLSTTPVGAGEAFGRVLQQIRKSRTVSYKSTVELAGYPPRTSQVLFMEPGRARKTGPSGGFEVSDGRRGMRLSVAPPCCKWALLIKYAVPPQERLQRGPLSRLTELSADSGELAGQDELDGRRVNVFHVRQEHQEMTIWADPRTNLPVRVKMALTLARQNDVSPASATLTLSEFAWNEELDESLFELRIPEGYRSYEIQMIDRHKPPAEDDLLAAFGILTDLSDGVFPRSLQAEDLMPILKRLDHSEGPAVVDAEGGGDLGAGPIHRCEPEGEPRMLKFLRDGKKRIQVSRGMEFVNQLTARAIPWRYVGEGVRRGEQRRVFWYRPQGTHMYRVILGDLQVHDRPRTRPVAEPAR